MKPISMTESKVAGTASGSTMLIGAIIGLFERIPYWLIALTARIALAQVFWS